MDFRFIIDWIILIMVFPFLALALFMWVVFVWEFWIRKLWEAVSG